MGIIEEQRKFRQHWESLIVPKTSLMETNLGEKFLTSRMPTRDKGEELIKNEEMKKIQEVREEFNSDFMSMYPGINLEQEKKKFLMIE